LGRRSGSIAEDLETGAAKGCFWGWMEGGTCSPRAPFKEHNTDGEKTENRKKGAGRLSKFMKIILKRGTAREVLRVARKSVPKTGKR